MNHGPLGKSLDHNSAAKVFSFTRAAYKNARASDRQLYDPSHPEGPAVILALGDYVVLTDGGWIRGYVGAGKIFPKAVHGRKFRPPTAVDTAASRAVNELER